MFCSCTVVGGCFYVCIYDASYLRTPRPARLQNWKIGKLKAKVATERKKLEKADADEAAGGGGGGAGEASRSVRRKLLEEAGDRE